MTNENSELHHTAFVRWKQGHQFFHLILVSMNTLLAEAEITLKKRNFVKLQFALERLTVLYESATASMKYTADFSPQCYEDTIRPSMMPPFLNPGFSGTQNKDHQQMIDSFSHLKENLNKQLGSKEKWPANIIKSWNAVSKAQIHNRKHHGLVCQKHVPDGISLLKNFYKNNNQTI
ncbi:hypothetical protein [Bacillus cereus]